jgi:hypothetical protein
VIRHAALTIHELTAGLQPLNSEVLSVFFVIGCVAGVVGGQALLNLLPNIVAGLVHRFEQLSGLIGDVLQVSNKRGAIFTRLQVLQKRGIVRKAFASRGKEIGQLLLKLSAG